MQKLKRFRDLANDLEIAHFSLSIAQYEAEYVEMRLELRVTEAYCDEDFYLNYRNLLYFNMLSGCPA